MLLLAARTQLHLQELHLQVLQLWARAPKPLIEEPEAPCLPTKLDLINPQARFIYFLLLN